MKKKGEEDDVEETWFTQVGRVRAESSGTKLVIRLDSVLGRKRNTEEWCVSVRGVKIPVSVKSGYRRY